MISADFYPLADALQMNLDYTGKELTASGNDPRRYHVGAFEMKFKTKAIASGVDKEWAWILVRVKGNLHVLMMLEFKPKNLELFIVDGGRVSLVKEAAAKLNTQPAMSVISTLFDGLIATYKMKQHSEHWKKGSLDDFALDDGQASDTPENDSPAAQSGGGF